MKDEKIKIYLASSWFTPNMKHILDNLETILSDMEEVSLYSPRRDGIVLPPNQKHDPALREKIFKENISNILDADLVVANIDSTDDYNDPGTVYEIGYAMAHNIPVIGFTNPSRTGETFIRFKSLLVGFEDIVTSYNQLVTTIYQYIDTIREKLDLAKEKILFIGNGDTTIDTKIASAIAENGVSIRWLSDSHENIYARIDEIFKDVSYIVAVIDDRKPLVSWMIGQAYARNIPIVTYSDFNWGINVMLLVSVIKHIRGIEELNAFIQQVKRVGIKSIPKSDTSDIESM